MSAMSTLPEFTHSPNCSCLLPRTLRYQNATCSHLKISRKASQSVARRQQQPAHCDDRMGAPEPDRDPSIRFEPPKQKANKNFNPFKNVKKEDAVRAALQDTFKGKEDLLAVYDRPPPGGGGKGGSGGSGGGRGGNWWNNFGSGGSFNPSDWGNGLKSALRRLGRTLGAVLLFMLILGAMALWQPVLASGTRLVRWVLRIDKPVRRPQLAGAAAAPGASHLGPYESAVIASYKAEDDLPLKEDESDSESESDEEDED